MLIVEIIGKDVYLDNQLLKKKKIHWRNHCREIFLNKDYVVKVVLNKKDDSSIEQNILESLKWKYIVKNKDENYFAPVVKCDKKGLYLVQKRLYFTSHKRTDEIRNIVKELCKKYDIGDVPYYENRNWGMIGRHNPVIYDYGSDEYWSE